MTGFEAPLRGHDMAGEVFPEPAAEPVQFAFMPIQDFRSGRTSALFCVPFRRGPAHLIYGYRAVVDVLPDTLSLDLLSLDCALAFTQRLSHSGVYAAVGAPVAYETLASSRSRETYLRKLREAGTAENPLLMLKIDALPSGIPVSRLAQVVQWLKPYVKRISVHLPDRALPLAQSGLLGASVFVFSLGRNLAAEDVTEQVSRLSKLCAGQAAFLCVDRIERQADWHLVRRAGAQFGAWAPSEDNAFNAQTHLAALGRANFSLS